MDNIGYYTRTAEGENGPYTINQLRAMWKDGRLTKKNEFKYEGTNAWLPLDVLAHQLELEKNSGKDTTAIDKQFLYESRKKSGVIAALLNFLLPGVGYMYCNRILLGIFVFIVSGFLLLITGFLLWPLIAIVVIIDGFLCADRENRKLMAQILN